jgi:hypothetical protein
VKPIDRSSRCVSVWCWMDFSGRRTAAAFVEGLRRFLRAACRGSIPCVPRFSSLF